MPETRGTGLLILWTDVDPEHEAEFNHWYNEEHIHHLLKVPGFLSAGRYEALSGGPKYLAMYDLEEPGALRTSAFLDEVRFRPSPWRTKASGGHVGRNYIVQAYRQIHPEYTAGWRNDRRTMLRRPVTLWTRESEEEAGRLCQPSPSTSIVTGRFA